MFWGPPTPGRDLPLVFGPVISGFSGDFFGSGVALGVGEGEGGREGATLDGAFDGGAGVTGVELGWSEIIGVDVSSARLVVV